MNELRTIETAWASEGRRVNNFDAIRFFAAAAVVLSHSFEITGGRDAFEPLMALTNGQASLGRAAVLIFFVLSGFLIVKSWRADPKLGSFFLKRTLRIAPALIAVVAISIFVIGPLMSALDTRAYFSSTDTWRYFYNATLYTKYYALPGVFDSLPLSGIVNGPLWTLKFEVICYCAVAALGAVRLLSRPICIAAIIATYLIVALGGDDAHQGAAYYVFAGADLARAFFIGVAAALFADKVILDARLGLSAALVLFVSALLGGFDAIFPLFGGYLVFYLGFANLGSLARFGKHGDFSYGIYVWGFPVQQIVATVTGVAAWYVNFALALPLALAAAFLSWRLVEAPSLQLKKRLLTIGVRKPSRISIRRADA